MALTVSRLALTVSDPPPLAASGLLCLSDERYTVTVMSQLGDWVKERRLELGMTQADVSARGGPSHQTMRNIEGEGDVPPIRTFTASRLEQALQWKQGSVIRAIKYGEKPEARDTTVEDQLTQMLRLLGQKQSAEVPTHTMSFRLPKSLHDQVVKYAQENGNSVSEVVREAVEAFFL